MKIMKNVFWYVMLNTIHSISIEMKYTISRLMLVQVPGNWRRRPISMQMFSLYLNLSIYFQYFPWCTLHCRVEDGLCWWPRGGLLHIWYLQGDQHSRGSSTLRWRRASALDHNHNGIKEISWKLKLKINSNLKLI